MIGRHEVEFFNGVPLADLLAQAERQARYLVQQVPRKRLLADEDEALVSEITEKARLRAPSLQLEHAEATSPEEKTRTIVDYGREVRVTELEVRVVVPFEGDRNLFLARPSSFTTRRPRGVLREAQIEFVYSWRSGARSVVKDEHSRRTEEVQQYLTLIRSDVEKATGLLRAAIAKELAARRVRVKETDEVVGSLGLPVRPPEPRLQLRGRAGGVVPHGDVEQAVDAFVCHASEDKEFVRPLATKLQQLGFTIWYDDFVLRVGDNLRRSIDRGLAKARFGVVVLSEAFFEKEWPQYELDGLVSKEVTGQKVILPVWRGVDVGRVRSFSPSLAIRLGLASPPKSLDEIVEAIAEELRRGR